MEDSEELWKTIDEFENYEVSNLGKVRNKTTGRILKPTCRGGYQIIGLCKNSKGKTTPIHRLVALAFIPNPENKPQVNHIDKNRSNNIVSNLEWNTALENNTHRSKGVIQTTNQNIKVWRVDILTGEKLELYNSIYDAANWIQDSCYSLSDNLDSVRAGISCAVRNIYSSSYGFKWIMQEQVDLEGEIWKNVVINGNPVNNYYVSNLGRFKNYKGIIMDNYKPHHSGYIYLRVNIEKYALHRLVAFTFIPNPENKPFVNHIDGNKTNNAVSNLEWCTVKENNQHNANVGLIKYYKRKIAQYDLENNLIKEYDSIVEAMKETGIKSIKGVLYGKQTIAGGYYWKYLD